MFDLEKFSRFLIAQQSDRSPVTFTRAAEEVVCLAFDLRTQSLVELHVLNNAKDFSSAARESFEERTRIAMEFCGPCFCQIIDVGEFEKMRYYATAVNDGEFLKDYVERVAPMDVPHALSLVIQLCDAVVEVESHPRLMNGLKLSNLLVCRLDDSHIALRMLDLGLAREENDTPKEVTLARKMAEISQILFYLLSGNRYAGNDPAQVNSLAGLPANLKVLLRQTLDAGSSAVGAGDKRPARLGLYRNELADSYGAVCQRITSSAGFRPLDAPQRLHPESMLVEQFFGDLDLEEQLGERYRILESSDIPISPYARLVYDQQKERETVVQFLPASRTLPVEHSQQVIQEMSRINEDEHPNLMRCRGFWETDRLACIAEEPQNGFSLPLLLSERDGQLENQEIIILLQQLDKAIRQAARIELLPQTLSIHSLEVHFPHESRFRVRELRKRHVDFWPEFQIKLRCHATLDSVVSVPPHGRLRTSGDPTPEWLAKMDFIGVAEHLALGDTPPPSSLHDDSELQDPRVSTLREFFQEQYSVVNESLDAFDMGNFIDGLESLLARSSPKAKVEVMGTIVDGAIAFADAAARRKSTVRESGTLGSANGNGVPRPMGEPIAADSSAGDEPEGMNPIARKLRSNSAAESEQAPESLGTIDDVDFDLGDSRDKMGVAPIPLGTIGEGDADGDESAPAANGKKPPRKKKGWFFLK